MLELYTSEPNTFFLKPLIALNEKQAKFDIRWFDAERFEQFALDLQGLENEVEAQLHLEREGPLLRHGTTLISNSWFMLEYLAEALPGTPLLPKAPYDLYRAHASAQFLGAHLGSLVPVLGCAKYLTPRLAARDRAGVDAAIAKIEPTERRQSWTALLDGTYTPEILGIARERLKFPVQRVEKQLGEGAWLAGPDFSIADIDAFALLRPVPALAPDVANSSATPRLIDYLKRIEQRPSVKASLAISRSGNPEQHFVPGVEPSRWG
jgi:glutathione S-transferase